MGYMAALSQGQLRSPWHRSINFYLGLYDILRVFRAIHRRPALIDHIDTWFLQAYTHHSPTQGTYIYRLHESVVKIFADIDVAKIDGLEYCLLIARGVSEPREIL